MYDVTNIATLYVSQKDGNDINRGFFPTTDKGTLGPLKSIETALERIAEMRGFNINQPITIKIIDDIYHFEKPIEITNRATLVTIEPLNKTLLSGSIRVDGFKKDKFNGVNCYSVDLQGLGDMQFSDFYINGKAAKLPKYPDVGELEADDVEINSSKLLASSKWFIAKEDDFKTIRNFKNIDDCFISYNHYWVDEHTPIEKVDIDTRKVYFKYISRFTIEPTHEASKLRYIIENVAEGFKNPNEFYYDRTAKKLYYIPEDKNTKAEDISGFIPRTDKLFVIKGTEDNKVKNIYIRNFDIAYTKSEYRSVHDTDIDYKHPLADDGYASDMQSVFAAHGSIEFEHTYGCSIENCNLFCLGVHAITLKTGSSNIRIINNSFTQLGAGAITVNGGEFGTDEKLHTCRNVIKNNKITYCGNKYFSACGILLCNSYENTIAHNEIGYLYYTGISCGWVWGYANNISHDNIIEKNHIHHLGQGKLSDMGGIYLLGKQPGTIVRGNLIHDITAKHYGGWALYTDEGSSNITLENNICYNTSSNCYHHHFGSMNVIKNNIFAFSDVEPVAATRPETHVGIIVENNIIVTNGKPVFKVGYQGAVNIIVSCNNIIWDLNEKQISALYIGGKECSWEEAEQVFGIDRGSVIADPLFEDIENFNFNLKENSPALSMGFKPIDMSDVGVN